MTNALNQYTSVGGAAYAYDGNGKGLPNAMDRVWEPNMTYDGDGMMYAYDPENRLTTVNKIDGPLSPGCDIALSFTSGGDATWVLDTNEYSYDHDSARSGDIGDDQETWLQTTVTGPGTLTFDYKLSCDAGDEYAFSIDGQYRSGRAGSKDWTESGPWTITGAGTHTIRWKFIKDSSGSSGSDCLWIDRIRWTGAMPDGEGWDRIEYAYDAAGRRIEKKVDGATQVKYVYDGDHIIAEYNNAGTLLRKYVHGPCVDEPICMIEASGTYAGAHYYHYDALGSCVAMTNSAGNVVQLYEYSVYGQVAASDADHPNRFMFTGREFDKDTGLYYYRARYYHPEIGRFLQTDPIGYGDGMNWYAYCGNNSTNCIDPSGLAVVFVAFYDPDDPGVKTDAMFTEAADDFPIYVPMHSTQDVLDWLIENVPKIEKRGDTLGAVWFFDHSHADFEGDSCRDFYGMEFGEEFISTKSEHEFWGKLGAALPGGTAIQFRHCFVGWDAYDYMTGTKASSTIGDLARWTNHVVTGFSGLVHFDEEEIGRPDMLDVPDYWSNTHMYWAAPEPFPRGDKPLVGLLWYARFPYRVY